MNRTMKKPARIVRDGAHAVARTTRCTMLVPTPRVDLVPEIQDDLMSAR